MSSSAGGEGIGMKMSKTEAIQSLVSRMKSGEISKAELFAALSKLPRGHPSSSPSSSSNKSALNEAPQSHPPPPPPPPSLPSSSSRVPPAPQHEETPVAQEYTAEDSNNPALNNSSNKTRKEKLELELKLKQLEECTFRPKTRPLPGHYGNGSEDRGGFTDRVMRWKDRRMTATLRLAQDRISKEMGECTFHPKINEVSKRVVEAKRTTSSKKRSKDACERLYAHSKSTKKEELLLHALAEKEAEISRTCTFKPKTTSRRRDPTPVRSRYRDPTPRKSRRHQPKPTGTEECTFTPRCNPVKRQMGSARMYLESNVFDRLSKRSATPKASRPSSSRGGGVMDMSTFMSSVEGAADGSTGTAKKSKRTASAPRQRPTSDAKKRSMTPQERAERRKSFGRFISRQKQRAARKEANIKELEKMTQPSHKPKLSKKSREIFNQAGQGSFLERVKKNALRKEHDQLRLKALASQDEECTFEPQITEAARNCRGRTPLEMSRGDSLKRETTTRLMRLQAEKEALAGLTFAPTINPSSARVEGRLRILTEPDTYTQRLKRESRLFNERKRAAIAERNAIEFKECTFKPEIHDAPAYVKRIAKSMALTRSAREPVKAADAKPDWR